MKGKKQLKLKEIKHKGNCYEPFRERDETIVTFEDSSFDKPVELIDALISDDNFRAKASSSTTFVDCVIQLLRLPLSKLPMSQSQT